ncbi:MAG: DUF5662 family protein [Anaerovoracaceae bacterium]|nr:DUF5662 family protein [Bacillota bacterium]MDY2670605.1 DUF5662 family protein [Anaerovoracaceae bacterium]
MHIWGHFKTITRHRHMVMKLCFKAGLYRQGLAHDLSKYSITEFSKGIRYYQGVRSPNNYEREVTGISLSWLHHKGRNKHHFEYWLDYDIKDPGRMTGMLMPRKYVAEMFCDRIAACRVYEKDAYTPASPARFFYRSSGRFMMNDVTRRELGYLLTMLSVKGVDESLRYVKHEFLKGTEIPDDYVECENLRDFDERYEAGELGI